MRKRFALLWTLVVLAAALAVPATTAAASAYQWQTLKNTCSNSGGANGYGKSVLSMRQWEYGVSGVRQFRVTASAQRKQGGNWVNEYNWSWVYSVKFPNNSVDSYFNHKFTYHWGSNHAVYYTRIKWRGEWLNGNGGVIAWQVVNGKSC
jgi:hypothetical protein